MIIVDTSVWIDFFNGFQSKEQQALQKLIMNNEPVAITGIILTEILQGIKDNSTYDKVKESLLAFPIYNPQGTISYVNMADIFRTLRKNGITVRKTVDCLIATVCIENDFSLLHKDNDFTVIAEYIPLKVFKV
ncbi:PIN domain nuclease [Rickettsiales bacterium LUAb2]